MASVHSRADMSRILAGQRANVTAYGVRRSEHGRVRPDAHRLRLRPDPPDGPDPRRPHHAAGPRAGRPDRRRPPHRRGADRHGRAGRHGARPGLHRGGPAGGHDPRPDSRSASAPRTTRSSRRCTRPPRTSSAPASRRPGGLAGESLHAVNIAGGLHHAMPDRAAGSASTTTPRSPSGGCWTRAPSGWPTSTWTRTTATASRRSSGTTRGSSPSPCTRPAGRCSPAPAGRATPAGRAPRAPRSTSRCRRARRTPAGCAPSTPSCPPLLREFAPEVLVTQHGCDSHVEDPLAHLMLSVDGQRAAYLALHDLAHEVAGGRWVAIGGGGYEMVDVVPRAWTPPAGDRRRRAARPARRSRRRPGASTSELLGADGPRRMTDGRTPAYRDWSEGYDPETGWTGRSWPPARRSSRCTGWTRCPDAV